NISTVISSGTYSPARMISSTRRPNSVPSDTWARNISPVDTWGTPSRSATLSAWVPLPAPGGPMNSSLNTRLDRSSENALVVAHGELRLDLFHRFEGDADHDEQGDAR